MLGIPEPDADGARATYEQFVKETMEAMPGTVEPVTWEELSPIYRMAWYRIFRNGHLAYLGLPHD